jgi:lysine decarboxylase
VHAYDETKLLVSLAGLGVTGYSAAGWLAQEWGVEAEISGRDYLLFSLTFADSADDVKVLVAALTALGSAHPSRPDGRAPASDHPAAWDSPRMALTPRDAFFAASAPRALREARNEVCAEWVIPYPPGIPILAPGEVIDSATIVRLEAMVAGGASMVGVEDPTLREVRIVVA